MNDEIKVRELFSELLIAISEKDAAKLTELSDTSLAVRHIMTGKAQSGADFISDVTGGSFTFFSIGEESTDMRIIGDTAFVIGKFVTDSAIYGMERTEHKLCMKLTLRNTADGWKYTEIRISACAEE
ncbi:MAG: nuclear transport factor 2 family protein [Ruminococcus sp.]|jgi:ketosteroid isomerase-like protein|nr:nuclear transport factor 2 family protein [Ruminococcus sp.]